MVHSIPNKPKFPGVPDGVINKKFFDLLTQGKIPTEEDLIPSELEKLEGILDLDEIEEDPLVQPEWFCYLTRTIQMRYKAKVMTTKVVFELTGFDAYVEMCTDEGPRCNETTKGVPGAVACDPPLTSVEIPVGHQSKTLSIEHLSTSSTPSEFIECACPDPCPDDKVPSNLKNIDGFGDILADMSNAAASFLMNALKKSCAGDGTGVEFLFNKVCLISKTPCSPWTASFRDGKPHLGPKPTGCDMKKITLYGDQDPRVASEFDEIELAPYTDLIADSEVPKDFFCGKVTEGVDCLDADGDGVIDPGKLEKFAVCLAELLKVGFGDLMSGAAAVVGSGAQAAGSAITGALPLPGWLKIPPPARDPVAAGANAVMEKLIEDLKDCLCKD